MWGELSQGLPDVSGARFVLQMGFYSTAGFLASLDNETVADDDENTMYVS